MSDLKTFEYALVKRKSDGNYRQLGELNNDLIDFSSNDYLGLARSETLKQRIIQAYQSSPSKNGSTGSRLLTGNSTITSATEKRLASTYGFDSSLIFSSGYMANLAFFSSVPQKGDTVFYDELSHACIKDGLRLSFAKRFPFKHNDLEDLKQKLKQAKGQVYIACESVYSMDGDMAPLVELAELCQTNEARLIIDEAHSTGVFGALGQGLVYELALQQQVFAVIHTFGKAMGVHGASISGSKDLQSYLINFARPFIYTTAPSDFEVFSISEAFSYLAEQPNRQANLHHKISLFKASIESDSQTSIHTIMIGGNSRTKQIANELQANGFDIRPILSPTVKEGSERLRICIHSFNSEEEIIRLASLLKTMIP